MTTTEDEPLTEMQMEARRRFGKAMEQAELSERARDRAMADEDDLALMDELDAEEAELAAEDAGLADIELTDAEVAALEAEVDAEFDEIEKRLAAIDAETQKDVT